MKIKLFDNEDYEYPIIVIKDGTIDIFLTDLDEYRKNEEYNIDDFLEIMKKKDYFIDVIYYDRTFYF